MMAMAALVVMQVSSYCTILRSAAQGSLSRFTDDDLMWAFDMGELVGPASDGVGACLLWMEEHGSVLLCAVAGCAHRC